jgi:hypothetical protein
MWGQGTIGRVLLSPLFCFRFSKQMKLQQPLS